MCERVFAVSGEFQAGLRPRVGFRVSATLPFTVSRTLAETCATDTQTGPRGAGVTMRVLLADDQPLLPAGLKVLIDSAPDLEVVWRGNHEVRGDGAGEVDRSDVVLVGLPQLDGVAANRMITADDDSAGVRVLILTTFEIGERVV